MGERSPSSILHTLCLFWSKRASVVPNMFSTPWVLILLPCTQLPFSAAELWSLHQYYFSPPTDPHCASSSSSGPPPSPSLSSAGSASTATAASAAAAAAAAGCGVGWLTSTGATENGSDARDGNNIMIPGCSPGGVSVAAVGSGSGSGSGSGRYGFTAGTGGVVDVDDGIGAGARRNRRSSSLGQEEDDEMDSPRPPSKRYRNSSTKTRIARFPLIQV